MGFKQNIYHCKRRIVIPFLVKQHNNFFRRKIYDTYRNIALQKILEIMLISVDNLLFQYVALNSLQNILYYSLLKYQEVFCIFSLHHKLIQCVFLDRIIYLKLMHRILYRKVKTK